MQARCLGLLWDVPRATWGPSPLLPQFRAWRINQMMARLNPNVYAVAETVPPARVDGADVPLEETHAE